MGTTIRYGHFSSAQEIAQVLKSALLPCLLISVFVQSCLHCYFHRIYRSIGRGVSKLIGRCLNKKTQAFLFLIRRNQSSLLFAVYLCIYYILQNIDRPGRVGAYIAISARNTA